MTSKEEVKKYERKIEELHSEVEHEAQELGRLRELTESGRAEANCMRSERDLLRIQTAKLSAELSRLRAEIEKERRTKKRGFVEYDSATKKAKTALGVLRQKKAQANEALTQKLKLSKDLLSLKSKCTSASATHKAILNSITQSQRVLLKEQQKSKGILAQAQKALKSAQEKEAQIDEGLQSLKKEKAKVLFYLRRINRWNKSKGLKPIEITL